VTRPMILIGLDSSVKSVFDYTLAAVIDAGIVSKCYVSMLDYSNIGDSLQCTWPDLQAAAATGLQLIPSHDASLLPGSDDLVNRPIPPYPVTNTDYPTIGGLLAPEFTSEDNHRLIMQYIQAIHEFYGIGSYDGYLIQHAAGTSADMRTLWNEWGTLFTITNGIQWNGTTIVNDEMACSLPASGVPFDAYSYLVNTGTSVANMKLLIDRAIAAGRFMCLDITSYNAWSKVDVIDLITYIMAYDASDDVDMVSPQEFVAAAADLNSAVVEESVTAVLGGTTHDETFFSGDDRAITVTITDANGAAVDITGWTFVYTISSAPGSPVLLTNSTGSGLTVQNAPGGVIRVLRSSGDTENLAGAYYQEIIGTDLAGAHAHVLDGRLIIKPHGA